MAYHANLAAYRKRRRLYPKSALRFERPAHCIASPKITDIVQSLACTSVVSQYFHPLKNHDFRWVFLTRFLMQQGRSPCLSKLSAYPNGP